MNDEHMIEDFILKRGRDHQNILDVGCGDGELLIEIAKRNGIAELYCVDTSIEYARNNIERKGYGSRIKCVDAKAENIPLESHSFDFIFSVRSLHEFSNPVKVLKEIKRLLSLYGEVIIVDWKKGTNTGVEERYYGKEELKQFIKKSRFNVHNIKIEESGRFNIISYSEKQS